MNLWTIIGVYLGPVVAALILLPLWPHAPYLTVLGLCLAALWIGAALGSVIGRGR